MVRKLVTSFPRSLLLALSAALATWGCGESGGASDDEEQGPLGFVGGPCEIDDDCTYEGAVCLAQGLQGGLCTLPCDRLCPDREGYPVTFCVDANELPASAGELVEGGCVSRCNTGFFQDTGCRNGYGCVVAERHNEPQTQTYACLPNRESELTDCHLALAARGVSFEPTVLDDESPRSHPELTCRVENPVVLHSPLYGVELTQPDGSISTVLGSCEMAHALASTVEDLEVEGVIAVEHGETYRCRVISGTDELSRHGYGDAIDLYGFHLDDGAHYTVVDDWERDTDAPHSPGGAFLYEATQRWFEDALWNIILTPNFNQDHYDHIHVDLTPGSHIIKSFSSPSAHPGSE
jgi:hypothetical protein